MASLADPGRFTSMTCLTVVTCLSSVTCCAVIPHGAALGPLQCLPSRVREGPHKILSYSNPELTVMTDLDGHMENLGSVSKRDSKCPQDRDSQAGWGAGQVGR